ncbi:hypothetical protein [Lentzea sp. NPDC059081]|uniref:hypothetical protein n=1 Tax=Lentzea sp. NPDC059081 TaxID=3346719 RepID=UPI003682B540
MSRSGLFRAAALLAAGAAPLLAGAANAAEVPQLNGGLPEVGADKVVTDTSQLANPLEAAGAVQLPHVGAPVASDLPVPAVPAVPGAQERSLPNPVGANIGTLPSLPNADALGNSHVGDLHAPAVPAAPAVPNPAVLSGVLPTING